MSEWSDESGVDEMEWSGWMMDGWSDGVGGVVMDDDG